MSRGDQADTRTKPIVSAIIPLYNQQATIVEAIESVLAQTRPVDEIVVIDDGSTDGSGDVVAQRYGDEARMRLIRQVNRGPSAARNTGIRAARSSLLAFLDADDLWLPERIEKQVTVMEEDPSCMFIFTAVIHHNERLNFTVVEGENVDKETYLQKTFFPEDLLVNPSSVMVRREVFDEVGCFDESLRQCEDTDMWLRIMIRFGFEHIPQALSWRRVGEHQTSPADLGKVFFWHDRYFAKHRYTFGRGPKGQAIWRSAYSSVMRREAIWYFRHGYGRQAWTRLMKAVCTWPFFNPSWTMKSMLEYVLGARGYGRLVNLLRKVLRRRKVEAGRI